jgi:hypothetical protein
MMILDKTTHFKLSKFVTGLSYCISGRDIQAAKLGFAQNQYMAFHLALKLGNRRETSTYPT